MYDPNREFTGNIFLKMETVAKAQFNNRDAEVEFYDEFFAHIAHWTPVTEELLLLAYDECQASGLNAMDALHVAAAYLAGATELVTVERSRRSIHRTRLLKVVCLEDL